MDRIQTGNNQRRPLFREVWGRIVGFEVSPLPGAQVKPVKICAVKVARCSSKHIQVAIYDDHCLGKKKIVYMYWALIVRFVSFFFKECTLPVRKSCWASSLCSWADSIVCTVHCKRAHHFRCSRQTEFRCHQKQAGCSRAKQLHGAERLMNFQWDFYAVTSQGFKTCEEVARRTSEAFNQRRLCLECLPYPQKSMQNYFKVCQGGHTWHGGQLCWHVTLRANLLPGGCGEMKAPQLSEQRVVFILRSARLLKVWIVAAKHI